MPNEIDKCFEILPVTEKLFRLSILGNSYAVLQNTIITATTLSNIGYSLSLNQVSLIKIDSGSLFSIRYW